MIGRVTKRHRAKEFLDFLRQIDRSVPKELDLHVILDNSSTHKTAEESERNIDYLQTFLERQHEVVKDGQPELASWIERFARNRVEAARNFWYETLKGIDESLREFF